MELLLLILALVCGAVLLQGPLRRELRHLPPHGRAAAYHEAMGVLAGSTRAPQARAVSSPAPAARGRGASRHARAEQGHRAARDQRAPRARAAHRRRRVRSVLAVGVVASAAALPNLGLLALPLLVLTGGGLAAHVWLAARLTGAASRSGERGQGRGSRAPAGRQRAHSHPRERRVAAGRGVAAGR